MDKTPKRARVTGTSLNEQMILLQDNDDDNAVHDITSDRNATEEHHHKTKSHKRRRSNEQDGPVHKKRQGMKVCHLLLNLPQSGTFTNVSKDIAEEYRKMQGPIATHQPTYNVSRRCKNVKNDEMNILVRALKVKRRKDREARRPKTYGNSSKKKKENEEDNEPPRTPVRGPRKPMICSSSDHESQYRTPLQQTTSTSRLAPASASSSTSSSSPSSYNGDGEERVKRLACVSSPRLGASRVRTPPPGDR